MLFVSQLLALLWRQAARLHNKQLTQRVSYITRAWAFHLIALNCAHCARVWHTTRNRQLNKNVTSQQWAHAVLAPKTSRAANDADRRPMWPFWRQKVAFPAGHQPQLLCVSVNVLNCASVLPRFYCAAVFLAPKKFAELARRSISQISCARRDAISFLLHHCSRRCYTDELSRYTIWL